MAYQIVKYKGYTIRVQKTAYRVIDGRYVNDTRFTAYVMKGYDVVISVDRKTSSQAIVEAKKLLDGYA